MEKHCSQNQHFHSPDTVALKDTVLRWVLVMCRLSEYLCLQGQQVPCNVLTYFTPYRFACLYYIY